MLTTFSTLNEIHEEIFESINSHSKAIDDESKKEIEKIFATFKVDENEKNFHLAKLEEQKLPVPTLIRHKRQFIVVAKLLVNQTAARLQSANATLANLKTPIKTLFLVWQLIVNLHAKHFENKSSKNVALQAKLDALKAQQASAGCVSTTTTTTTTSTTTPTTNYNNNSNNYYFTTTTTTTTASPLPCFNKQFRHPQQPLRHLLQHQLASPSTCNACGILKTCIIGSPSTCTCPSTKTKNLVQFSL
ncbi:hypothetical protein PVAND_016874 [Polypedilum vanderplanki]|uniref:Uncharacterized protein n=1 Tax=Polypedilum vanderplanki TaxID=319348 RepID=A0A9J6BGF7_POLVA|nr:hypothetical protein PVAND_016874 [Polypedilum vanderplanki]